MKHTSEVPTVYRVRQRLSYHHPNRSVRHAWYGRTWQAEGPDQVWAPRASRRAPQMGALGSAGV